MKLLALSALQRICSDLYLTGCGVAVSRRSRNSCSTVSPESEAHTVGSKDATLTPSTEDSSSLINNGSKNESMHVCAICLSSIWKKELGTCDPCGHVLHQSCFCEWAMTRKSFFFYEQDAQKTKCPVCNTEVHKMRNLYWTSGSGAEDMGYDDDCKKLPEQNDCSYYDYLENRVQEETAAIKLRISLLEEQVELVKNQNTALTEHIKQVLLDMNKLKYVVEQEKQRRLQVTGPVQSEQQRLDQSYGGNNSLAYGRSIGRRRYKRQREVAVAAAATAGDDVSRSSKRKLK